MPKQTFFNLTDEKRNLILELAIEEFSSQDFKNASITNIVAKAGIAKGSFYQYFEDKRDLYFYLIELASAEKKRFLTQSPPPDPQMGLFDYLRWLIRVGASFEFSQPKLAQVAYRALFSDRPFGGEILEQLQRSSRDFYFQLLKLGIEQGDVDPEIDMETAVFFLSTLFTEFGKHLVDVHNISMDKLASGKLDYKDVPLEEATNHLISLIERGLRPCSYKNNVKESKDARSKESLS